MQERNEARPRGARTQVQTKLQVTVARTRACKHSTGHYRNDYITPSKFTTRRSDSYPLSLFLGTTHVGEAEPCSLLPNRETGIFGCPPTFTPNSLDKIQLRDY